MTQTDDETALDGATPLHEFVWLATEAGLHLPPVPQDYLGRFQWNGMAPCFWTDPTLVPCLTRVNLLTELAAGRWPTTGMAMRFASVSRWVYWSCLIAGGRSLVLVDLRMPQVSEAPFPLARANDANLKLAAMLADEITLSGYLSDTPSNADAPSRAIIYANPDGTAPVETHYVYTRSAGLSAPVPRSEVFADIAPPAERDTVIIRP